MGEGSYLKAYDFWYGKSMKPLKRSDSGLEMPDIWLPMRARVPLDDEPLTSSIANVRGNAQICPFIQKPSHTTNFLNVLQHCGFPVQCIPSVA